MSQAVCNVSRVLEFNMKKAREAESAADFMRAAIYYYAAAINAGSISTCSTGLSQQQRAAADSRSSELAQKSRAMQIAYEDLIKSQNPGKTTTVTLPCPEPPQPVPCAEGPSGVQGGGGAGGERGADKCPTVFKPTARSEIDRWTWEEIVGADQEKKILEAKVVFPIRFPAFFKQQALRSADVLLYGPGGTGKTTLIKVVANMTGLPMYEASAADIKGGYVSQSEKCLKDITDAAKRSSTKGGIVFLDEADGILAGKEGEPGSLLGTYKNIVQEQRAMPPKPDSFLVVAATNNPKGIGEDEALLSRFTLRLFIGLPNRDTRKKLFEFFMSKKETCGVDEMGKPKKIKLALSDSDWKTLMDRTVLFTPRDIKQLVDAALSFGPDGLGPGNLTNLVFCPNGNGAWIPVLKGNQQGRTCRAYSDFSAEEEAKGIDICWPDLPLKTLLKVLDEGIVKRATTRSNLKRFLAYSQAVQDEVGRKSIQDSLDELTQVVGPNQE